MRYVMKQKLLSWGDDFKIKDESGRDAFYVEVDGESHRIPWEQVEAADWDRDTDTFRLSEVGSWGDRRPVHTATLPEPGRLLELVRERVTASVVLQRHVPPVARMKLWPRP